jgi:CsoR family transcriptional regulator, copper-sensing transcriptional repressor
MPTTSARPRHEHPSSHGHAGAAQEQDARSVEILRRLKSVEGHVRGIERMVEEDAYCMDVVNQVLAVQRALKKVSALVLDRHLHTCATSAIRGEDVAERERILGEILDLFEATGKV